MKHVLMGILLAVTLTVKADIVISASSALVIDVETNAVLLDKASTEIRSIASITKLMTAVVIMSSGIDMNENVAISTDDIIGTRHRGKATYSPLSIGIQLTRSDMLHMALMNSNNRAAYALARTFPGSVEEFVRRMNCKALELGMVNTKFADPTGLNSDNQSTATDLALLIKYASQYELIRQFSTSESFRVHASKKQVITFGTTNRLVRNHTWVIQVQKTGFINEAGHCMVMLTTIAAKQVIIVLLNTPGNTQRAADANTIKKWLEHK